MFDESDGSFVVGRVLRLTLGWIDATDVEKAASNTTVNYHLKGPRSLIVSNISCRQNSKTTKYWIRHLRGVVWVKRMLIPRREGVLSFFVFVIIMSL